MISSCWWGRKTIWTPTSMLERTNSNKLARKINRSMLESILRRVCTPAQNWINLFKGKVDYRHRSCRNGPIVREYQIGVKSIRVRDRDSHQKNRKWRSKLPVSIQYIELTFKKINASSQKIDSSHTIITRKRKRALFQVLERIKSTLEPINQPIDTLLNLLMRTRKTRKHEDCCIE